MLDKIIQLKEENQKLKKRVQILEEKEELQRIIITNSIFLQNNQTLFNCNKNRSTENETKLVPLDEVEYTRRRRRY